jgi:hypothetical protein
MKRHIAYFDFLGYKEFVLNNNSEYLKIRIGHILVGIEQALSEGILQEPKNCRVLSDTSTTRINCLNISDTVIFWTNDDSIESLEELLRVAYRFNWTQVLSNFPVRGIIYFDELEMLSGKQTNTVGAIYSANLIYGKGLANAHLMCENLNWAGSAIDETVINQINGKVDVEEFLKPFAKIYNIPYTKPERHTKEGYALRLVKGNHNKVSFKNAEDGVVRAFKSDNKTFDKPRVQEILANTISYLETFKE